MGNWTTEEVARFNSRSTFLASAVYLAYSPGVFLNAIILTLTVWPNLIQLEVKWFFGSLALVEMCLGITQWIQVQFVILHQETITTRYQTQSFISYRISSIAPNCKFEKECSPRTRHPSSNSTP